MTKQELQQLREALARFFSLYGNSEDVPTYQMVDDIINEVLSECDSEELPVIHN